MYRSVHRVVCGGPGSYTAISKKRGLAAEPNLLEGDVWSDIGLCSDLERITDGRRAQESDFTPVYQPDCSSDHDHCYRFLLTAAKMIWKCNLFY